MPSCRTWVASLSLLCFAAELPATWSILIVDTRTKEIAIASATCVAGYDLRVLTPVLLVGKGACTAQSYVDASGQNRLLVFNELGKDTDPAQILQLLAGRDSGHQTRQYGMVDVQGRAVTFSGTQCAAWAGGVTGRIGSIVYAVQGNILTGDPVVKKAEEALRNTQGDLAARLMAAMEAAHSMGGDGRCSCSTTPTGCGSPPKSFTKSAHIAYMLIAREGDKDGTCNTSVGCASGQYYMTFNLPNWGPQDPEPVAQLRLFYDYFRIHWRGHADHHLTTVALDPPSLPSDGATTTIATVTLRDWENNVVDISNAIVNVSLDAASTTTVGIGAVTSQGKGVYTFPVTAGTTPGSALLRIVVDDGLGPVLLSPRTEVRVSQDPLWVSRASLPAASGGQTRFVLQAGASHANRLYVLLASNSGSSPGIRIGTNLVVPVNPDPFFQLFLHLTNRSPELVRTFGALDGNGRAAAQFNAPPAALLPIKGTKLTFAFAALSAIDFASNPVVVAIAD